MRIAIDENNVGKSCFSQSSTDGLPLLIYRHVSLSHKSAYKPHIPQAEMMSELEKLKHATDLSDLANLLGYKPKFLSYIIYKIPNEDKYSEFSIPKKTGGVRKINKPEDRLKHLQRRLANLLNNCFEEICNQHKKKDKLSHGFRKNRSIISNGNRHKGRRYVFNIDLDNFFPSINFGRVRGFFISNNHFLIDPKVATIIAQIACHNNELPQGSPCSPVISNLIGHLLDIRLSALAAKGNCNYSRYADDLTFSTNRSDFSPLIAKRNSENGAWTAGKKLRDEIRRAGFAINDKKTSMQFNTSRQIVTGLVVNKKVNIKREYYRLARSMCHSLFASDEFYISKNIPSAPSGSTCPVEAAEAPLENPQPTETSAKVSGTLNQLEGMLSFIYQVKGLHDIRKSDEKRKFPAAVMALYRKFLFYRHFFALNEPLIICEGKTDIIYLKCALKQLAKKYPELVEQTEEGVSHKIRFLNMSPNIKEVLAISDGTGGLGSLMSMYKESMEPFKGDGKKHPVIILIDNDHGAKEIKNKLKSYCPTKLFFHFTENLYVIHTPPFGGKDDTAIEDLFTSEALETKIDGKKFNPGKQLDVATEYGKIVFAEKVIRANHKNVDFNGFIGVFDRVVSAMNDYHDMSQSS